MLSAGLSYRMTRKTSLHIPLNEIRLLKAPTTAKIKINIKKSGLPISLKSTSDSVVHLHIHYIQTVNVIFNKLSTSHE
jgi:hypothetical protein